ncbi:hypothetical protein K8I31_03940, partial [bacterium]|nr:hypothetical protein [bacterium]
FVPNYIMIDVIGNDLSKISEQQMDRFIDEFIVGHGFNGVHIPVLGQWFHIGDMVVTKQDETPDERTLDKLAMIIQKVYDAGGCTHLWMWGDDSRSQTTKSTRGGIMGPQEKRLLDAIAKKLGPLKGWSMGYGFDLWEWVNGDQLKQWHSYLWSKPGWNHLLGARSETNKLTQIYEGLDYSSYEYHKPWYDDLVEMINRRPQKPSFSEDRYRIRHPSKYPDKDYNADETRRGLWHHAMAGGVAAIWGNLDGDGVYPNKDALKCFSIFWNDKGRLKKDMATDNAITDGYCLNDSGRSYVFYKENCKTIHFKLNGAPKTAVAVDARKAYAEINLGQLNAGGHTFEAPYESDWAIAVE